jgi:hypothetical protein
VPYLNSDDKYPEHPKVEPLSDGAYRLHSSAMHYAARHLTDGAVPAGKLRRLVPNYKRTQLAELLEARLLHAPGEACDTKQCRPAGDDEYVLHDFLEWNKPREWWLDKRAKDAARQAEWRAEQERKRRESQRLSQRDARG